MSTVITVENLGKKYSLHHQQSEQYTALRDVLANSVKRLGKRILSPFTVHSSPLTASQEDFWALKDVSFEVKQGDRIGIIGRNGAGKSTLLKILSRITEPTTGSVKLKGRVASLLEVGTGFHPELTGRENIFLNGAILGMGRVEIKKKFDEIVDFAEIEKFLDTPVKRYSSGMYVRLAFAVAAHLEPEILVVDEVLAVGDAQFQKKCLGKMGEVSKEGRTVLFVSHNMAAIRNLCTTAVLLERGVIKSKGEVDSVIGHYLQALPVLNQAMGEYLSNNAEFNATLCRLDLIDKSGNVVPAIQVGESIGFRITINSGKSFNNVVATIGVNSFIDDLRVCLFYSLVSGQELNLNVGYTQLTCYVDNVPLSPGRYRLTLKVEDKNTVLFYLPGIVEIDVIPGDYYGTGRLPDAPWGGLVMIDHTWSSSPLIKNINGKAQ